MERYRPLIWMIGLAGLGLGLAGCGESRRDVIGRYAPQGTQWRNTLAELAGKLPPAGSVQPPAPAASLSPLPTLNVATGAGNVEVLMESQLTDPDSDPEFDLLLSTNLVTCLRWTGPRNPMVESALSGAAGTMERDFQRAFGCAYLAIIRVVRFQPPRTVGENQFEGGEAELEVFLVRTSDLTLVGGFPVRSSAAESVQVEWRERDDRNERARAAVHSSAWVAARKQIAQGLREISGGEFIVER